MLDGFFALFDQGAVPRIYVFLFRHILTSKCVVWMRRRLICKEKSKICDFPLLFGKEGSVTALFLRLSLHCLLWGRLLLLIHTVLFTMYLLVIFVWQHMGTYFGDLNFVCKQFNPLLIEWLAYLAVVLLCNLVMLLYLGHFRTFTVIQTFTAYSW